MEALLQRRRPVEEAGDPRHGFWGCPEKARMSSMREPPVTKILPWLQQQQMRQQQQLSQGKPEWCRRLEAGPREEKGVLVADTRDFLDQALNHTVVLYFHPKLEGPEDYFDNFSNFNSSEYSSTCEHDAIEATGD